MAENRQRYIAFVIEDGYTDRRGMIAAIRDEFSKKEYDKIEPWLTVFDEDRGIVRCKHTGKKKAIEILNRIEVGGGEVKTIKTSGTIKKAKKVLNNHER